MSKNPEKIVALMGICPHGVDMTILLPVFSVSLRLKQSSTFVRVEYGGNMWQSAKLPLDKLKFCENMGVEPKIGGKPPKMDGL